MLSKKKIALIVFLVIISAYVINDGVNNNFSGLLTQQYHITATIKFLQTEHEYRKQIENTEQVKWFEKTFPNYKTEYIITYGFRNLKYTCESCSPGIAILQSTQGPDNTIYNYYWCINDTKQISLLDPKVNDLKTGNCFK